jgi:hypothetical protein
MNREQKIDFLNGLANGTRSIGELIEPEVPSDPVPYHLGTFAERYTFLWTLRKPLENHGQHVSTKSFTEQESTELMCNDFPKRSRLQMERRGRCIRFDTVFYQDPGIDSFTHIHYDWNNRSLSVFPTSDELIQYQQMSDDQLTEIFEQKINELLNP